MGARLHDSPGKRQRRFKQWLTGETLTSRSMPRGPTLTRQWEKVEVMTTLSFTDSLVTICTGVPSCCYRPRFVFSSCTAAIGDYSVLFMRMYTLNWIPTRMEKRTSDAVRNKSKTSYSCACNKFVLVDLFLSFKFFILVVRRTFWSQSQFIPNTCSPVSHASCESTCCGFRVSSWLCEDSSSMVLSHSGIMHSEYVYIQIQ